MEWGREVGGQRVESQKLDCGCGLGCVVSEVRRPQLMGGYLVSSCEKLAATTSGFFSSDALAVFRDLGVELEVLGHLVGDVGRGGFVQRDFRLRR